MIIFFSFFVLRQIILNLVNSRCCHQSVSLAINKPVIFRFFYFKPHRTGYLVVNFEKTDDFNWRNVQNWGKTELRNRSQLFLRSSSVGQLPGTHLFKVHTMTDARDLFEVAYRSSME